MERGQHSEALPCFSFPESREEFFFLPHVIPLFVHPSVFLTLLLIPLLLLHFLPTLSLTAQCTSISTEEITSIQMHSTHDIYNAGKSCMSKKKENPKRKKNTFISGLHSCKILLGFYRLAFLEVITFMCMA